MSIIELVFFITVDVLVVVEVGVVSSVGGVKIGIVVVGRRRSIRVVKVVIRVRLLVRVVIPIVIVVRVVIPIVVVIRVVVGVHLVYMYVYTYMYICDK